MGRSDEASGAIMPALEGLQPVRTVRAADLIASQLRRQIVKELDEGQELPPENVLVVTFGVSRQTLREAFRVLEFEGLLTVRRGVRGGAIVHKPSERVAARSVALVLQGRDATVADVYQARAMLEPACAAHLAAHRTDKIVQRLRSALEETADTSVDPLRAIHAHLEFHSLVTHLAENQTVALLADLLGHVIDQATEEQVISDPYSPETTAALLSGHKSHVRLVELVDAGDEAAARDFWHHHLRASEEFLLRGANDQREVIDLLR